MLDLLFDVENIGESAKLVNGDCLDVLKALPDNSIDSVVTDPPYGLSDHKPADVTACLTAWLKGEEYKPNKRGFMGQTWDSWVPGPEVWREVYRVLKPGGHVVAFAGSRTHDLMSMALRLAGFENRDTVMWVYGSGFPKSMYVSKAIDKAAGAEREFVGEKSHAASVSITAPATDAARQWQGWGTTLKPAFEPALLFRKPLIGTVAENVLAHGTGVINVDGCRVDGGERPLIERAHSSRPGNFNWPSGSRIAGTTTAGRWPANLIHDGSDEVVALFPDSNGSGGSVPNVKVTGYGSGIGTGESAYLGGERAPFNSGSGSAARFFYCAKASKRDRNQGCEGVATWEFVALDQEIHSVLSLAKVMSEGITHLLDDSECSMTLCGSITTGQYLTDTTFIISTVSRLITALKTSNFSQSSTTRESILDAIRTLTADGSNLAENAEHISQLTLSITSEKTVSALGAVSVLLKTLSQIKEKGKLGNAHSTVKPTDLMAYLCRLVTPPHGTVLDPFMGSGSTGKAAMLEGFRFIGIEREADYVQIAKARIEQALCGDLLD